MFGLFDIDKWEEIWTTITSNKMRSIMTGFGVFWGIFMLAILIGIGNGFIGGVMQKVEGFAANSCFFFANPTSEPYQGFRKGRTWSMNNRDLEIIKQKAKTLDYLSPLLWGNSSAKNIVIGRKSAQASVIGVYPDYFGMQKPVILYGRIINDIDISDARKIAVIGRTVAETLFEPGEDPVGKYIRVNGIYFQVAGVIRPLSSAQIGSDANTSVYIPFSTMQKTFNQGDKIHFLGATTKPGYEAEYLENEIKSILKENHDIAPNDDKAVRSFNVEKEFKTFNNLFIGVTILIWIVGLGSLFSGIIGVSNIMMVTVRERTREIGVRRALGAKPITIIGQIMSESFVLTFIAGFMGLFLGVLILSGIGSAMESAPADENSMFLPPYVPFGTAMIAMMILIVAGLFAGFIPAIRALKIKAIDAIRDE